MNIRDILENMEFNNFGSSDKYIITTQLGNTIIEKVEVPDFFASNQFISMVQQVANDSRPIQIKCIRYDYTEQSNKQIENSLTYSNHSFVKEFELNKE